MKKSKLTETGVLRTIYIDDWMDDYILDAVKTTRTHRSDVVDRLLKLGMKACNALDPTKQPVQRGGLPDSA